MERGETRSPFTELTTVMVYADEHEENNSVFLAHIACRCASNPCYYRHHAIRM